MDEIEKVRLSIIAAFQAHNVEGDVFLYALHPDSTVEYLAECHTKAITTTLLVDMVGINEKADSKLSFIDGHLNASNPNTFLFRFKISIDPFASGGLC